MFDNVSEKIKWIAKAEVCLALVLGVAAGIALMVMGSVVEGILVLVVLPACAWAGALLTVAIADIDENLVAIRVLLAQQKKEEKKPEIVPAPIPVVVAAPAKEKKDEAKETAAAADAEKLVAYALRFTTDEGMRHCVTAKLNTLPYEDQVALAACLNAANPRQALAAWLEKKNTKA